jgi:hypothetical protein
MEIQSNPTIRVHGMLNVSNMNSLQCALWESTQAHFGYMPQELQDVGFCRFILTLCKKRWTNKLRNNVEVAVIAWSIGYGLGRPNINWS